MRQWRTWLTYLQLYYNLLRILKHIETHTDRSYVAVCVAGSLRSAPIPIHTIGASGATGASMRVCSLWLNAFFRCYGITVTLPIHANSGVYRLQSVERTMIGVHDCVAAHDSAEYVLRFAYISFIRIRISHLFVWIHESGIGTEIRNSATCCVCACGCVAFLTPTQFTTHIQPPNCMPISLLMYSRPSCVIVNPSKFKWPRKRRRRQHWKKIAKNSSACEVARRETETATELAQSWLRVATQTNARAQKNAFDISHRA